MNAQAFLDWLKQPSTIKAVLAAAGLVGYKIDPSKAQEIIEALGVIYIGIQAFYNQQPRKPPVATEPTETPLTEERFKQLLAEAKSKKA